MIFEDDDFESIEDDARKQWASQLDNPQLTEVTVVYLRGNGTTLVAQQLFSEGLLATWHEGIDYIRGRHADDSEEVQALVAAKKLVGSVEDYE